MHATASMQVHTFILDSTLKLQSFFWFIVKLYFAIKLGVKSSLRQMVVASAAEDSRQFIELMIRLRSCQH